MTPIAVPSNRKQAFSSAWPRVGAARIATVRAAEEGASSSSQKLAARAITTATQMRIAETPRRSTERRQSSTDAGWSRSSWDRFSRCRWRGPGEGRPDGCGHANDEGDAPCNGAHDLTPDAVRS